MSPITDQYSGIVANQDAIATGMVNWRSVLNAQTIYQTFYLPATYTMGTTTAEERRPDLSGCQVMVDIDEHYAPTATLDVGLDHYVLGSGWTNLITGTVIGAHNDGTVWMDIIFAQSIPIAPELEASLFRIGITARTATNQTVGQAVTVLSPGSYKVGDTRIPAHLVEDVPFPVTIGTQKGFLLLHDAEVTYSIQQGISGLWYTTPNPLGVRGNATLADGKTPLLGTGGAAASINFRVLGLTADSGTDFLGNEFRSTVIQNSGLGTDTSTSSWMSPPQPSQFAVLSRYFDIRPAPGVPPLGTINLLPNPSAEWDVVGGAPFGWLATDTTGVTRDTFLVQNGWAAGGTNSIRSTSTFSGVAAKTSGAITPTGLNGLPANGGVYSASAVVNVLSLPAVGSTQMTINILWYDPTGALITTTSSQAGTQLGVQTLTLSGAQAPPTTSYLAVSVTGADTRTGELDFFVDTIILAPTSVAPLYGDGDSVNWEWTAQKGRSASAQLLPIEPADDTSVIDGILLDPLTPQIAFNVYYSVDDAHQSEHMTEEAWEQKLWSRVPQVFTATQAQQYVFPEPVNAKYIKVEFTNLQPQVYDPGAFQQPVVYKKFPTWVADFFIAQLEAPSFVATQVNVQNDALTFAYAYYLDDLHETPRVPVSAPPSQITNLSSFFSQSDAEGLVDASTLAQINTVMKAFQLPTGSLLDSGPTATSPFSQSLLSQYAINTLNLSIAPDTSETPTVPAVDYSTVSTLFREPIIFEQSLPVMFFFLPSRHTYKELSASFAYNRAYFAGVRNISFLRHNYQTSTDASLYVESGGDTFNAALNDFVVGGDGTWTTYAI